MYMRFHGWGWIVYPITILGFFGGLLVVGNYVGFAIGLIVSGLALRLLGRALNGRWSGDGGWLTDPHRFFDRPIQMCGRDIVILGILVLPLTMTYSASPLVMWGLFLGWAIVVTITLRFLGQRRQVRKEVEEELRRKENPTEINATELRKMLESDEEVKRFIYLSKLVSRTGSEQAEYREMIDAIGIKIFLEGLEKQSRAKS